MQKFKSMKIIFRNFKFSFAHQSKFCIIGGGTGGVNIAAHLLRSNINPKDISIFEPTPYHYYQAGWTLVGSGMALKETTRQLIQKVIPDTIHIVREQVAKIDPQKNLIITDKNHNYTYQYLIISAGFKLDWHKIKNSKKYLDDPYSKVCSIYDYLYAQKTYNLANRFVGGKAIFTQPPEPIKCAGAPQKIMFLLHQKWNKNYDIDQTTVNFIKASKQMFSVQKYSKALQQLAQKKQIELTFNHDLIEIIQNKAIFQHMETKQKLQKQYDFLHIVPPMSPPKFIEESGLANQKGYVDLDKQTLQHTKYANIWGLGDCSSLPTSKTAAAIFSQSQTLLKNILAYHQNHNIKQFPSKYNGYTSCPIFVGDKKVALAEFLYEHKIDQSFYSNQQIPRRSFYYLTKYGFPLVYWKLMPRGLWKGRDGIRWF